MALFASQARIEYIKHVKNETRARELAAKLFLENNLDWPLEIRDPCQCCGEGEDWFGWCDYERRTIGLATKLVQSGDEKEIIVVIRHEIAHALVGYSDGHGVQWRTCARKIGVPERHVRRYEDFDLDTVNHRAIDYIDIRKFAGLMTGWSLE